jgi:uroporphyrinogen-III synthase
MSAALAGIVALVTRPSAQGEALVRAITAAGGRAIARPLIEILPLAADDVAQCHARDAVLAELAAFDMAIFISTNAVRHALARVDAWPPQLRCLAIGQATARRLAEAGLSAGAASQAMNSEELLALPELAHVDGRRIVLFKGVGGRDFLARELSARGAQLSECPLYRRAVPQFPAAELLAVLDRQGVNALLLSSADALDNLQRLLGGDAAGTIGRDVTVVTPGERVAALAREQGFQRVEVALNATDEAMLQALARLAGRLATPAGAA